MSATIPSVWPTDIGVDVVTPLAFLRMQANQVESITKGVLHGEVRTVSARDQVSHSLELVAPVLDDSRKVVLTVQHEKGNPYPAKIDAEYFQPDDDRYDEEDWRPVASSYPDLIRLVKEALNSPAVIASISSLIARSNEQPEPDAEGEPEG